MAAPSGLKCENSDIARYNQFGMDFVFIEGLEMSGFHGYYDEERREGNRFRFDVRLYLDTRDAAVADDLDKTANYAAAVETIREVVAGPKLKLIETLAERIAERILANLTAVSSVHVRAAKLNPPLLESAVSAGVEITRSRGA